MKSVQSILAAFMAVAMCVFSVGCASASSLVNDLNAVSDATAVLVVVAQGLALAGTISPADATLVANYATSLDTVITESDTELGSSDDNTVKIGKISGYFAAVVGQYVPKVGAVAPEIAAITAAIDIFLKSLNSSATVTAAKAAPKAKLPLNHSDRAVLKSIRAKVAKTNAAAAKLKAPVVVKTKK